jgi:hypothetical protein
MTATRLISPGKSSAIFIMAFVLIAMACKKDNKYILVGINIETAFEQDQVQVFLDGQKKIDARATTQWTIGACIINGKITDSSFTDKGEHEIRVIINNSIAHTEKFSLNSQLFLRVLFDRQANQVSIIYSGTRPIYD